MPTTTWITRAGVLLCAGALLAGCSSSDEPAAVAKSGGDTATSVDPAALDTGSYPTEPSAAYGTATEDTILDVETQRLAEFVVVPFEVDPELVQVKMPTMVMRSPDNLGVVLAGNAPEIARANDMLYGYVSTAATQTQGINDPSRSLVQGVIRFGSADGAAAAAQQLHTDVTTNDTGGGIETPESIAILPNTLVSTSATEYDAGPEVSANAFTAHGDYLLYTYAQAPADQKDWTAKAVATALDLQSPLIDRFPATPTKEQRNGAPPELPLMDQDKILIYAIPENDEQAQGGDDMAVYGPRGMAHTSTNPPLTYKVLSETGSEHNASYKTIVYRAKDDAGAQRILDDFTADQIAAGYTNDASPQGLPDAKCVSQDTAAGTQHYCTVAVGRYVGEASALDDKKDVDQQISAQYLILQKADQNAG